jgi:hypothetical protein
MESVNSRWFKMNRVLLISIALLFLFAWMDTQQLVMMKNIDNQWQRGDILWPMFYTIQQRAVMWLWIGVLAAIGIIWYLLYKDKSEALALFLTPAIMIWFGTQDLIYFVLSPIDKLLIGDIGCWANRIVPMDWLRRLFGLECPTNLIFVASAVIGMFIAGFVYSKLQKYKPIKGGKK